MKRLTGLPATVLVLLLLGCGAGARQESEVNRPDSGPPTLQEPMTDSTTIRASGTVRSVNIEGGCWRFDAQDGKHYEISQGGVPSGLLVDGKQATLILRPRPDLMSTCMIGPIVEVVKVEP